MDENKIEKIDLGKVDWRGSRDFFESLGEALDRLDNKDESYDFTWVGKRRAIIEAGSPINKTLRPDVDNSKNWDTTENLFIEGDNLDALKLLQESYLGKVKMIYIDPPYNTGKDFVYHDNFRASVEQYDEDAEYKDESGNIQFKKNEKTNGRYHSDWLSMMYPRLKLARNILTEDGVIFISIDDNEQANLKKLCDEIFGEDNFIAKFDWRKKTGANDAKDIAVITESILAYAKNHSLTIEHNIWARDENSRNEDRFNKKDEFFEKRGKYYLDTLDRGGLGYIASLDFGIEAPNGNMIFPNNRSGKLNDGWRWKWGQDKVNWGLEHGFLEFVRDESKEAGYSVKLKNYQNVDNEDNIREQVGRAYSNLITDPINQQGGSDFSSLFDGKTYFSNPKPIGLISYFLRTLTDKTYTVLDFFSGSASSAHAILQLNAIDGGSRKWIMVQLSEVTDESSEAFKAGYKSIPEIARERIRRAGDKIAKEHPEAKIDYGFRSLRIDDTNYKDVYKSVGGYDQSSLLESVDNVKADRSDLDLLYGVLTQSALELNCPLETKDIAGAKVFLYDYLGDSSYSSGLIACFAENVPEETVKEIAKLKPLTAVFRDSSFADSQAKVNLAEHFRILSSDTKVKVI